MPGRCLRAGVLAQVGRISEKHRHARPLVWAVGLITALLAGVVVALAGADDAQGFELAWRVLCTPVSSMLTAP